MSAATMNEMERLKRVNTEWEQLFQPLFDYVDENGLAKLGQCRVKALIDAHEYAASQLDAALEREAALAAHVERLQLYGNQMMKSMDQKEAIQTMKEFEGALKSKPDASLTKRELIKQAEALVNETVRKDYTRFAVNKLLDSADELRQQAAALDGKEE